MGTNRTAVGTGVGLMVESEPTCSDGSFEVPVGGEGEVVAIGEAESRAPSLLAFRIAVEEGDVGDVIVDIGNVETEEMLIEGFAEVIAEFGVDAKVAEGLAVGPVVAFVLEGVESEFTLEGEMAGETKFCTEVGGCCGPIEGVGLECETGCLRHGEGTCGNVALLRCLGGGEGKGVILRGACGLDAYKEEEAAGYDM